MNKYIKRMMNLVTLLLISSFGVAQIPPAVKGTVTDDQNIPLPGVSIQVKGTQDGTVTDFDGNYNIEVESGNTLVFSYIGYQNQEIKVTSENETINVVLLSGELLDNVVVLGSRNPNRTATETTAPVDVVDIKELRTLGPQINLNQIMNYVAPSFTSNTQTISDGTDHIDPASLRGLGPDQVLVLINGKRRHTSSLINVNGTFGRGNVGTDLNAIPAAAIERIEILRDGASAQYGSDAIAGVINIVLKKTTNELDFVITTGANMTENANDQTGGVDGEKTNISANYGLSLGKKGGYINFTGDFDIREHYSRMKEFEGGIFNAYNAIEYIASQDGYNIADLPNDLDAIKKYGAQVTHLSTELKSEIANASSISELNSSDGEPGGPLMTDVTEAELSVRNLTRSDFNMRVGQSALRGGRFFTNISIPLDEEGTEIYSFTGISSRTGNSAGFYRLPNDSKTYTPTYINGFLPEINSTITDQSIAVGIRGKVNNWNVDFSNTYGKNAFLYTIGNTYNASLLQASSTFFDAGGFSFAQNTTNLDINQYFDDILEGFNLAFGAEYRLENYEIVAGEEQSYGQYTQSGELITLSSQTPSIDFFGRKRPGGAQVFPGFQPNNELSRNRNSVAGYIDLEANITERFLLNFATRYEDYSDFGSTLNFKLATLVKINDNINFRGSGSTGFRAPSLHQLNFNSTSTVFEDGISQEVGAFSNDSKVAKLLGIPDLKEEVSQSLSLGFTAKIPSAHLSFTADAYIMRIDDRIVYTDQFSAGDNVELQRLFAQANATKAAFFANAIDTESKGLEVVVTHKLAIAGKYNLKTDLSATFFETDRVGDIKASDVLEKAGLVDNYFGEQSRLYLKNAVPNQKANLSFTFNASRFSVLLRNTFFGTVTEVNSDPEKQQVFSEKVVTDLSVNLKLLENTSLSVGANNLFDIYPDKITDNGNRSSGRFDWSRRSQQFGIAGRYVFARLNINL